MVLRHSRSLAQNIESSSDVEEEFRDWIQIVVAAGVGAKNCKVKEYDDDQEGDDVDGAVEQGRGVRAAEREGSRLGHLSWSWQHFQYFFCSGGRGKEEEKNDTFHLVLVASMLPEFH